MNTASFRFTPRVLNLIRRHAELRRSGATIAKDLNCSEATIETICRQHGIELVGIPDGAPPLSRYRAPDGRPSFVTVDVAIGTNAMELIRREAARRGVKATTLIARVAEIVAADQLFAAVLDR
jgi:hypothetical protein